MTFAILTKFAVAGVCSCDNRDSNRNPLLEFSLLQEQTPATANLVRIANVIGATPSTAITSNGIIFIDNPVPADETVRHKGRLKRPILHACRFQAFRHFSAQGCDPPCAPC